LWHIGCAVAAIEGQITATGADPVTKQCVVPAQRARDLARVGIEQQLVGIEAMPAPRIVGTVDPVTVERAGPRVGQVAAPHAVYAVGHGVARDLMAAVGAEDAKLHPFGVLGVDGEVGTAPVPVRAEHVGGGGKQNVRQVVHDRSTSLSANTRKTVASGGRVMVSEKDWPWRGSGTDTSPPPLPTLEPP